MKAVAEFAMRGRFQALLITVIGAGSLLFCWISAAVMALVTLRKGAGEGAWLLMWALLPAGTLLYIYGDGGPLSLMLGVMTLAMVLRFTVNLSLALLAVVPVGAVSGLALMAFGGDYLNQVVTGFSEFLATLEQQLSQGGEPVVLPRPDTLQIAGMLGAGTAMTSVLCLLLARHWQAALYNPGGFGEEFRGLYFPPGIAAALLVGALALFGLGASYSSWAVMVLLPLTFAGLALVHAWARHRQRSSGWLVGFYLAWLFFDPVKMVVVIAAVADSWYGFRQRWNGETGGSE
jgi:hypothetical protein